MEEVKDVAVEEQAGDSENPEGSSPEQTEGEETSETLPTDDTVVSEEGQSDGVKDKPIPYSRFKEVNDQFRALKTELNEVRGSLKNPEALRGMLKELGYEDQKQKQTEDEQIKSMAEGLDLSSPEGWMKLNWRMAKAVYEQESKPFKEKFSEIEKEKSVQAEEGEAKRLCSEVFGVEFGDYKKDANNLSTAVGKMNAYLDKHPKDEGLGLLRTLKLAMAEEGFTKGKQAGENAEKTRQKNLKKAAMEGDAQVIKDEEPSGDWPTSRLMEWSRKHNK